MWVHVLPGRARARVPGLRRRPARAALLQQRLLTQPGVRHARANPYTATVLIIFDPAMVTLEQLAARILPESPVAGEVAGEVAAASEPLPVHAMVATGPEGLCGAEVNRRRARFGANRLPEPQPPSFLRRLLDQYREAMQLTLAAGAGLALLSGNRRDALTIGAVLALGGILGAREAGRSSRAHAALRHLTQGPVRVMRDGAVQMVPDDGLVPGDLLLLEAGDQVPADADVVTAVGLGTDERLLTGEGAAVAKGVGDCLHAGTAVVCGRGTAVVTTTGATCTLGRIAALLAQRQRAAPWQQRLEGLGLRATRAGLWLAVGVTGISLLRGHGVLAALLGGVSLAISAVPDGLLTFLTLALSHGARRIRRQGGSFQSLAALETMGAVTTLCCDKTGTLTRGEMTVTEVYLPDSHWEATGTGYSPEGEFRLCAAAGRPEPSRQGLRRLLGVAGLCNNARLGLDAQGALLATGDAAELALLVAALKVGLRACGGEGRRLAEVPFDPQRRRMLVVCAGRGDQAMVCAKGAPEALLPLCTRAFTQGSVERLDVRLRRRCQRAAAEMAGRGLRVLAVAYKPAAATISPEAAEQDLVLLGLAGLADPPRPEAAAMVAACERSGVRVMMLTGDHPATAGAIARQAGLPAGPGALLTGEQLAGLDDQGLDRVIGQATVIARVTPEQKLRVVHSLRRTGQVVAMAGDGINDAPAMQAADVGIALGGRSAGVARATAGLVLEDDRLETVTAAIAQGRATRGNMQRLSRFLLGSNAAEVCLLATGMVLSLPLPLLPLQLLWMHLAGNLVPASALGTEPPSPGATLPPPTGADPLQAQFGRQVVGHGLRLGAAATGVYTWALLTGRPLPQARTLAMATLAGGQVRHLFACAQPGQSPQVGKAGAVATALALSAAYLPPLRAALQFAPLGPGELLLAAAAVLAAGRQA